MQQRKIWKNIFDYLALTVASFIFAFAWEGFMIPNGMSAGGMMGLCTVVEYATSGMIEAQHLYLAINALLILIAVIVMGIGFGFKTLYSILVSSLFMQLIAMTPALHSLPGEFFFVEERVLIPVIAGGLEALGLGLVLRFGGSTGGTDIIALMVNKYWPVSLSTVFAVSDFAIVTLLLFLPDKAFTDLVYGMVEIIVFSLIIDFVVGGKKSSYQVFIFSERYNEIADYIIDEMDRGVTVVDAHGWYSKRKRDVLLVIVNQKQMPSLSRAVKEIDPRAFMSVSPTNNVYGEGFDEIKTGFRMKKKKDLTNGNEKTA